MRRLFFIFILLLLSIYLGVKLKHDPGYLFISFKHWTVESTLWVALLGLMICFFAIHSLLILFGNILQIPNRIRRWRVKRRSIRAQQITRKGLIEFSEGYWATAKNHLIKALPNTDTPLLNYLTAARAAQEMGDSNLRDKYLREAQQTMPDAKIAVELTQAQLQLANNQWEQALATLRHLHDLAPDHPYVLKQLMYLCQEVRDWPQLITLLPLLKKHKVLQGEAFEKLRSHTYLQAASDLAKIGNAEALSTLMSKLPKDLRLNPDLVHCYSAFLINNQQYKEAESLLRRCLRTTYDDDLITLYGLFYLNEKQVSFAESLIKKQDNSPLLYLCLGRLSLANKLWGKAKYYFEKSLSLQESPETYAALGQLSDQLHEADKARLAYQKGLNLALKH